MGGFLTINEGMGARSRTTRGARPACHPRASARSTSRDGRDDAHLVLGGDDGRQVVEVADVFIIDVDVDEAPQLVPLENALAERGELGAEVRKNLADGRAVGVDDV